MHAVTSHTRGEVPSYKTLSGAECLFRFAHAMLSFSGRAAPHSEAMFRHACAIGQWATLIVADR